MKNFGRFIWVFVNPKNILHYDNFLSLALFILFFMGLGKVQIEFLNPISDAFSDVELTDIVYSQFDKNGNYRETINGETELDPNITLINIGHLSRGEIADLISMVNAYDPKVIGLDALFRAPKDTIMDTYLASVLSSVENLVLACEAKNFQQESLDQKHGIGTFNSLKFSTPQISNTSENFGFVNIQTEGETSDLYDEFAICRKFIPEAKIQETNDTIHSFGAEIVYQYQPQALDRLHQRNLASEVINYVGNIVYYGKAHFRTYDWYEVFDGQIDPKDIKDKLVLFGFMGNTLDQKTDEDRFFTPLNDKYIGKAHKDMYGVVLHANIISTILKANYIDEMSDGVGIFIGLLISFFVFAIYRPIYYDYKVWYDGVTKLIGIVVVFLIMTVIGYVFWKYDYEIKFHPVFLGIVLLAGDYLEIYYGLGKNIARKIKFKKKVIID